MKSPIIILITFGLLFVPAAYCVYGNGNIIIYIYIYIFNNKKSPSFY